MEENKIVAAICHAPWILISAQVVRGRRISCPPDMTIDITNAGGIYTNKKCVRDGNLITAEYYAHLPEMFRTLIPVLAERKKKRDGCPVSDFYHNALTAFSGV